MCIRDSFGGEDPGNTTTIFGTPKEVLILDNSQIVQGMNGSASSFSLLKTYDTARTRTTDGETITGSATMPVSYTHLSGSELSSLVEAELTSELEENPIVIQLSEQPFLFILRDNYGCLLYTSRCV